MSTHAVGLEARSLRLDSVDLELPQADHDAQPAHRNAAGPAADILADMAALDPLRFIVDTVKRIETLLEQRHGAAGRGLHTKVDSVREALPADLVKQLRWIATMRNKTMHEDGFFPEDMPRLRKTMVDCVLRLEQSGHAAELPAARAAPAEAAEAAESPTVERAAESGKRTAARRAPEDDAGAASSEPKRPSAASAKRDARAAADAAVAFRRLLLGLAVCTAAVLAIALT